MANKYPTIEEISAILRDIVHFEISPIHSRIARLEENSTPHTELAELEIELESMKNEIQLIANELDTTKDFCNERKKILDEHSARLDHYREQLTQYGKTQSLLVRRTDHISTRIGVALT